MSPDKDKDAPEGSGKLARKRSSRSSHAAIAARIRVARAWAGVSQDELAERTGRSVATIKRMESGQRPVPIEELLMIGETCDVPPWFMLHGFDDSSVTNPPAPDSAGFRRQLDELARRMSVIERRIG